MFDPLIKHYERLNNIKPSAEIASAFSGSNKRRKRQKSATGYPSQSVGGQRYGSQGRLRRPHSSNVIAGHNNSAADANNNYHHGLQGRRNSSTNFNNSSGSNFDQNSSYQRNASIQDAYLSNNTYYSDSSHNETYTAANKLFQHFQNDRLHQNILDKNRRVKSASTLQSNGRDSGRQNRNANLGSSTNPKPQKIGDKIVSRNGYSGGNRNGFVVEKRDKTGRNIVDGGREQAFKEDPMNYNHYNNQKINQRIGMNPLHKATSMGALYHTNSMNNFNLLNDGGFSDGEAGLMNSNQHMFPSRQIRGYASDDHLSRYSQLQNRASSTVSDRIESFLNEVNIAEREFMHKEMNQLRRFGASRKSPSVGSINSRLMGGTRTSSTGTLKAPSQSQKSVSNMSLSSNKQWSAVGGGRRSNSMMSINESALGSKRRMSRTSTTPTASSNHINSKSSISIRIPTHSQPQAYTESQDSNNSRSMRPKTAPSSKRSNSVNENKRTEKQIVPKSNTNPQRRQQRPRSSMNLRSNRNKDNNSSSTSVDKQQYTINPNVTSKLRQSRNYQPPRRKARQRSSSSQGDFRTADGYIISKDDVQEDRYAEDFEDDIEVNGRGSNQEGDSFEYDDDEDDDVLIPEKRAWLYEQALRGQARQRAASQLQAVLRSDEQKSLRKSQNNIYHQEKESSKDSAYGFSGGETSRMGNPHTREPTPEEKNGDMGRYRRPNSRYSSSNARYRRYHKVRGNNDGRKRHTSSSRSDDERIPERNQKQIMKKNLLQQQLRNRNDNFLSDSSHPQDQTPPKVFSSPTNVPKSSKNGLSRFTRPQTAYGSTKTVLPNKMSLNSVQRKNGDTGVLPSSEKVDLDPKCIKFLNKVTSEILRQGIYSDNGIRRALDNCLSLSSISPSGKNGPQFSVSKMEKEALINRLKRDLGLSGSKLNGASVGIKDSLEKRSEIPTSQNRMPGSTLNRSTSLSSTSSALSTTNAKVGHRNSNSKRYSRENHNSKSVSKTENEIAYLKSLLGPDGEDLSLEDISDSVINELLSSARENNHNENNKTNDCNPPRSSSQIKTEQQRSAKHGKSGHQSIKRKDSMTEDDWKWREPTDDENDSYRDDAGGLTLKVHSSILDESVNISNLNVSFNAALQSRSHSATMRKKAQRNEQKALLVKSFGVQEGDEHNLSDKERKLSDDRLKQQSKGVVNSNKISSQQSQVSSRSPKDGPGNIQRKVNHQERRPQSSSNEEKQYSSTEDDQQMNETNKNVKEESEEEIQENESYSNSNFEEEEEDTEGSIAEEIEPSE